MGSEAKSDFPPLFRECSKCGGSGTWNRSEKHGSSISYATEPCPDCENIGAIPTPEGRRILDLIGRWRRTGRQGRF